MMPWMRWPAISAARGDEAGANSPSVRRDTMRLVAFSDAVFAITVTLLVLEIKPPKDENLLHGLLALWPSYLAYALTFLFIGHGRDRRVQRLLLAPDSRRESRRP
jgi:steroid 5-alpha reductase family enzyme